MQADLDLKKLWGIQEIVSPQLKELKQKASNYKQKTLVSLLMVNVVFVATTTFFIWNWNIYETQWLTTKIGIILCVFSMVFYVMGLNKIAPLLFKVGFDMNSQQYLEQLIEIKQQQSFLEKKMLKAYFILLFAGLVLSLLEHTSKMPTVAAIFSFGTLLIWLLVNWFYFAPKHTQKREKKLDALINNLEKIKEQLER